MTATSTSLPDRIAFIADAHLGRPGSSADQDQTVASFLKWLRGQVSHLYIVGDLFDFWFEYRTVVPNTAPEVVFELYNLVQAGTKVVIFAGNHDYWLGPYLKNHVGLEIETDGRTIRHQGRNIFVHHGDGFFPGDHGYRLLKKVLRNPVSIFLFRLLHPDFAARIARLTSKTSREYLTPPDFMELNRAAFRDIADRHLDNNCDAVVYGHAHTPHIEQREHGTLVMLGDCIDSCSHVILEDGQFTLRDWNSSQ